MGPRKDQVDRLAWQWAETTTPDDVTQEHVLSAYILQPTHSRKTACKRNCQHQPLCISGLGEQEWLQASDETRLFSAADQEPDIRPPLVPAGLKNLGATCYVNSLLQLWFHNSKFKRAILQWQPSDDPTERLNETLLKQQYTPMTPIGHLQLIFGYMHGGLLRTVDPSPFILSLRLDTMYQQDAQEFSKLFSTLLEEGLSHQSRSEVSGAVQGLMRGQYQYVTRCNECLQESTCPSYFYELDLQIQGQKHLTDCLAEFLREESLTGANQYNCRTCQEKRDATRAIRLTQLPPVLNFQLMRFVFDRETGLKKKLSSHLRFPEVLDMSEYVRAPGGTATYRLQAVLLHKGPSAYSGHYTAHICDGDTGAWFRFNDEDVEKIKALRLNAEDELEDPTRKAKTSRCPKGYHSSNQAYMLVYGLASAARSPAEAATQTPLPLPDHIQTMVDVLNATVDDQRRRNERAKSVSVEEYRCREREVREIYPRLACLDVSAGLLLLPADWLTAWLAGQPPGPVDMAALLCQHGCLSPWHAAKTKCVDPGAGGLLVCLYGGAALDQTALCCACIQSRCRSIRAKLQLEEDARTVAGLLRATLTPEEPAVWMGKTTLRIWKRLALLSLPQDVRPSGPSGASDTSGPTSPAACRAGSPSGVGATTNPKHASPAEPHGRTEAAGGGHPNKPSDDQRGTRSTVAADGDAGPHSGTSGAVGRAAANGADDAAVTEMAAASPTDSASAADNSATAHHRTEPPPSRPAPAEEDRPCANGLSAADAAGAAAEAGGMLTSEAGSASAGPSGDGNSTVWCGAGNCPFPGGAVNNTVSGGTENSAGPGDAGNSPASGGAGNSTISGGGAGNSTVPGGGAGNSTVPGGSAGNGVAPASAGSGGGAGDGGGVGSGHDSAMPGGAADGTAVLARLEQLPNGSVASDSDGPGGGGPGQEQAADTDDEDDEFNGDVRCVHGELCVEQGVRRLVPAAVWTIMTKYFADAEQYSRHRPLCAKCREQVSEDEQMRQLYRQLATEQRAALGDLYSDRLRPPVAAPGGSPGNYHAVGRHSTDLWRKFLKDPLRRDPATLESRSLLCRHSGLLFSPLLREDRERMVLLYDWEWEVVKRSGHDGCEVIVTRGPTEQQLSVQPEPCDECIRLRLAAELQRQLQYTSTKIFIRKVDNLQEEMEEIAAKRPRLDDGSEPVRRSSRQRRTRGEKPLSVASTDTLRDLKVQIMKTFKAAPYDQHLVYDGVPLLDGQATLGHLGIVPGSTLLLKVDEASDSGDITASEDQTAAANPEMGFKGTGLVGS